MNFGEMKAEVRTRLNELTANYWSDQDIEDALNEGLDEISDATEWFERMTTITFWSGRTYLDARSTLSDTFLAPKRCINNQTGKWMEPSHVRNQDARQRQWEKVSTEPEQFFMRGIWWLGFYPKPKADSGSMRLYFSSLPAPMSLDDDEPEFPSEYHMGIVDYALYDLMAQDAETKKALIFWQEYSGYETGLKQYVQQRTTADGVGQFRG